MGANPRTKGQCGEREVAKILNGIIAGVRKEFGIDQFEKRDEIFQRNQNQSAVGGDDLSNNLGLSIEVKRQETFSLSAWWGQCVASAKRSGGLPILIYRKNHVPWRVRILTNISSNETFVTDICADICLDDFKLWFELYYRNMLKSCCYR